MEDLHYIRINNENDLIAALRDTAKTLLIASPVSISNNITIPENFLLHIEPPGLIVVETSAKLKLNCSIQAGFYKIFDCKGTVLWGGTNYWDKPQPLNQLWFGKDDNALQCSVKSMKSGGMWYFPTGIYKQETKIVLPKNVTMYGDGPDKTIIISNVYGDFSIEVPDNGYDENSLRDFHLLEGEMQINLLKEIR